MTFNQTSAVTVRVLRQLSRDKRFVVQTLIVPVLVIYMLWVFFEAVDNPMFDRDNFVPPISAFLVHFLTYVLCAIVLVRERSAHTLTRMFVNGYKRVSIIGGYLAAYSLLATLQSLIVLVELNTLFDLNYDLKTFVSLYGVIWLLAIISISLGILVSNFARNEGQVFPFIPLVLMPSVFFSGMIVSVDSLPDWASVLSLISPMYYANDVIQGIIGSGADAKMLAGLVVYGVAVLGLAVMTLREQD
jgi:ABC-2 type transport system permease protein